MFGSDQALTIVIKAVDNASAVIKRVSDSVASATFDFEKATVASQKFAVGLGAVATGVGAFLYQGIQVAANLETQRQGFITLLGSTEKADAALKKIKQDAATTPFELPGLISANQLLTSVTKDADRSERFLLNIGKALAAMGKGQPELDRIIVNLQQIGAVGKASMLDLKQFAFAGIPIFDMLKKSMADTGGVIVDNSKKINKNSDDLSKLQEQLKVATLRQKEFTDKTSKSTKVAQGFKIDNLKKQIADVTGSLGKLNSANGMVIKSEGDLQAKIEDGLITFEMLEDLFNKAGEGSGQFARAFIDQAGTFNQLFSNMKDTINIFMADFVKSTGVFDYVKSKLGEFVEFMNKNKDGIIAFFNALGSKENQTALIMVAGAIAGALVPAFIALGIAIGGALMPLLPFMVGGAVIAGILAVTGGVQGLLDIIDEKTGLITLFQWAWDQVSTTFTETLLPALQQLWDALKPLEPLLGVIGKIIGGVLLVAIYGVVMAITGWVQILTAIIALGTEFYATITEMFVKPIEAFIGVVKTAVEWVSRLIEKMDIVGMGKSVTKKIGNMLGFEHGGTVPGAVGQAVPIIAHGQERIIPAGQASKGDGGGGMSFSIVINNPVVRSQSDLNDMRSQMNDVMRDLIRVHKLQTI
jgi:tape measure domain-containing protein